MWILKSRRLGPWRQTDAKPNLTRVLLLRFLVTRLYRDCEPGFQGDLLASPRGRAGRLGRSGFLYRASWAPGSQAFSRRIRARRRTVDQVPRRGHAGSQRTTSLPPAGLSVLGHVPADRQRHSNPRGSASTQEAQLRPWKALSEGTTGAPIGRLGCARAATVRFSAGTWRQTSTSGNVSASPRHVRRRALSGSVVVRTLDKIRHYLESRNFVESRLSPKDPVVERSLAHARIRLRTAPWC